MTLDSITEAVCETAFPDQPHPRPEEIRKIAEYTLTVAARLAVMSGMTLKDFLAHGTAQVREAKKAVKNQRQLALPVHTDDLGSSSPGPELSV